jgi:hypothetical protein
VTPGAALRLLAPAPEHATWCTVHEADPEPGDPGWCTRTVTVPAPLSHDGMAGLDVRMCTGEPDRPPEFVITVSDCDAIGAFAAFSAAALRDLIEALETALGLAWTRVAR